MNDISTIYAYFSAIDYKGSNSLSSYALPSTPLRFVTDLPKDTQSKILWNFGDGTTATTLTALKSYEFPGKYNVNLVIYDCYDNALISTFTKVVTIYDYFPYTFTITPQFNPVFEIGKISGPFEIRSYYPPYQPVSSVFYTFSGSKSENYWSIVDDKFSHLESFYTLYERVTNFTLSSYQYNEIDRVDFAGIPTFAKIVNGTIIPCLSSDESSFFVGTSALKNVYVKDDSIGTVNIKFQFDKNNNYLKSIYKDNPQTYMNNMGVSLSARFNDNIDISHLSITSNGCDGEEYHITSFDIAPIKFYETKIPFIVKIKDSSEFSVKNFPKIDSEAVNLAVTASPPTGWSYDILSINDSLSAQGSGGAFRGYVTFTGSTSISNVQISAYTSIANDQGELYNISGTSSLFNVYPKEFYDIYKTNEDFSAEDTLKSLRFQESLLDKTVLFDEFLGTVFGNGDSSYDTIGKKTYEKIANFVRNISDVDTSEDDQLFSMIQMMGASFERINQVPENIKRFINILSIGKNRLFGVSNKFKENFDIQGRSSKTEYGINLGDQIDNSTYVISAGIPIVALEKFSNQYTLLNTMQPLCATGWNYQLSAYSPDWGWPLVLPDAFLPSQFPLYYDFFEYVERYDDHILGGVIDFGNTQTTLLSSTTYNELYENWGIADNIFSYTLYDSLSLFN